MFQTTNQLMEVKHQGAIFHRYVTGWVIEMVNIPLQLTLAILGTENNWRYLQSGTPR